MRLSERAREIGRVGTRRAREQDGFTMIFALLTLLIGGLLVAAAFSAADGDIRVTQRGSTQAKAYYAALAGINRYQYQLTSSPESWTKCPTIAPAKVTGTTDESYSVKTLGATGHTCESGKQATILETTGVAKGTFRILSTGTVTEGTQTVTRKIVATFSHPGFTKYVYESNYEVEDPVNYGTPASTCEHYYAYRKANNLTTLCPAIQFAPEDQVKGPMHTNDASAICSSGSQKPTFGREGHEDEIAMSGGYYSASGCSGSTPTINGKYTTTAGSLLPPATDVELLEAAGTKYNGRTEIELKTGTPNTMKVTNKNIGTKTVPFPSNGVIYVENSKSEACAIANYTPFNTNTVGDTGCGNVYVHGEYTESLTIASADDVIVNGNLTTTTENGEPNGEPAGGATLGLIAENFVRVYHPVKQEYKTENVVPTPETPFNGKCVTVKEPSGNITRSTEVTGIPTTGLSNGDEVVEGSVAGTIESGTTLKVEGSEKLKLSKAAKPPAKEFTVKTPKSTEISEINTTGLVVNGEVEVAGQVEATISEIKASEKKIKLSKALKPKELTGLLLRNEVTKISTSGLANGNEIEGTVAGEIEAGTTVTVEAGEKLKLSKPAKLAATTVNGKITSGSTEITSITTTGLTVGEEIEGASTQFATGTTITEIPKTGNKIKVSNPAKKTETVALKFYGESTTLKLYSETTKLKIYGETTKLKIYHATGSAYNATLSICHKVEGSPYNEYNAAENRYYVKCESESSYTGGGFCEYENSKEGCSKKAENLKPSEDPNGWGAQENLDIDAAILSTNHSWIVDNYECGKKLGTLTVWGSIAQFWRGPVGTGGSTGSGYIKNYVYDERLASQQPPSFLNPTNASSWKVSRETAPPTGFTG
jgi:Tfp pilus assembly protein PilX